MLDSQRRVPLAARWLGGLGVIPFAGLAMIEALQPGWIAPTVLSLAGVGLIAYGAVILSFLGGVHWGLAIAQYGGFDAGPGFRRLTLSVIPSLVAWVALLVPVEPAFFLLGASFLIWLGVDWITSRHEEAPAWYPALRVPLTSAVIACLAVGWLA
ncbi:MAG: DUF3429 domain-containing protein [Magnetovibrionaceae bacterium]